MAVLSKITIQIISIKELFSLKLSLTWPTTLLSAFHWGRSVGYLPQTVTPNNFSSCIAAFGCPLWLIRKKKIKNLNYKGNLGLLNSTISGPSSHKSIYSSGKPLTTCLILFDVFVHTSCLKTCSIRDFGWRGSFRPLHVNLNWAWSGRVSCSSFISPAPNKWLHKCSKWIALLDSWNFLHPEDGDMVFVQFLRQRVDFHGNGCCALITNTQKKKKKKF